MRWIWVPNGRGGHGCAMAAAPAGAPSDMRGYSFERRGRSQAGSGRWAFSTRPRADSQRVVLPETVLQWKPEGFVNISGKWAIRVDGVFRDPFAGHRRCCMHGLWVCYIDCYQGAFMCSQLLNTFRVRIFPVWMREYHLSAAPAISALRSVA